MRNLAYKKLTWNTCRAMQDLSDLYGFEKEYPDSCRGRMWSDVRALPELG